MLQQTLQKLKSDISGTLNKQYTLRFIILILIAILICGFACGFSYGVIKTTNTMIEVAQRVLNIQLNPLALGQVMQRYPEILWLVPEIKQYANTTTNEKGCLENDLSERCK